MSDLAIEVYGLVKRYAGRTVVDDVSFTAHSGRVLALLGPNGAGKTTTVETCEGYRAPDSGRVRVRALDPVADRRRLAPLIGVMLAQGGVYPSGRPREVLRLFASFYANPLDPDTLIDRMGLRTVAATTYRRLSGGEKQRLSLALAIVGRPSVLFLDEPTTGLDPQARAQTWELVSELRDEGACVLLTTHSMEEAERLADDVVILDQGHVVAAGTPADLTGGDTRQATFDLPPQLDAAALGASLAASIPAGCTVDTVRPGRLRVVGAVDATAVAAITSWCAAHGVMPANLRVESRSLEDVFLELTGRELR